MTTEQVKGMASECILAGLISPSHSYWLKPPVRLRDIKTRRIILAELVIESGPNKDKVVSHGKYHAVVNLEAVSE